MRQDLKKRAVKLFGNCCLLCGEASHVSILDFHHINPQDKLKNVSEYSSWTPELEAELDKCALLCKNCHTKVHNDDDFDHEVFTLLKF